MDATAASINGQRRAAHGGLRIQNFFDVGELFAAFNGCTIVTQAIEEETWTGVGVEREITVGVESIGGGSASTRAAGRKQKAEMNNRLNTYLPPASFLAVASSSFAHMRLISRAGR